MLFTMFSLMAIIYTLTDYEFLILGSKHPTVLFTDHKPIIFLFTQKSNPNHRVYRFQLNLMKFPILHIVWTAGKNLALPDTLIHHQNYLHEKLQLKYHRILNSMLQKMKNITKIRMQICSKN